MSAQTHDGDDDDDDDDRLTSDGEQAMACPPGTSKGYGDVLS